MLRYYYAQSADLPEIVDIYNSTIASRMVTADTEPQTIAEKQAWFDAHNSTDRPLWVVRNEREEMLAWMSFTSFYGRPAYHKTVEVSIYIKESERGKGLGKTLLNYAIEQAKVIGVRKLLAFIFKHNEPSMRLFEQAGFEVWGYLPDVALLDNQPRSLIILGLQLD